MTPRELKQLSGVRSLCDSGEAKRLREAAGLQLSEIAVAVGVGQATVWRWENHTRQPTGPAAIRYATLLDLLSREGANP